MLTSAIQSAIVEALAGGATHERAAAAGGIALRTLYSWVQKGTRRRKGDRNGEYRPFAIAVRQASAQARRTAAAQRRSAEAEERVAQPNSKPRSTEAERMHFARTLRRALHPPVPGSAEARALEAEYSQSRARLGITGSSGVVDADEEPDEAEQERLLELYLRMKARDTHNSTVLRGVLEQRGLLEHRQDQEQDDQERVLDEE
jgi:hypothetical protein